MRTNTLPLLQKLGGRSEAAHREVVVVPYAYVNYTLTVELRSGTSANCIWSQSVTVATRTPATPPPVAPAILPGMFQVRSTVTAIKITKQKP